MKPTQSTSRAPFIRIAILAIVLGAAWLAAERAGWRESMSTEGIQLMMTDAGPLGVVAYLAAFAAGLLAQLPGVAFVLAARVAYGPLAGFAIAYAGALLAVSVSFVVVRAIGGRALTRIKWGWAQRLLARLDERPVLTIALLRTVFMLSPPLNYALAMSKTRLRHYVLGSAIGLVLPLAAWAFLSGCLLDAVARL